MMIQTEDSNPNHELIVDLLSFNVTKKHYLLNIFYILILTFLDLVIINGINQLLLHHLTFYHTNTNHILFLISVGTLSSIFLLFFYKYTLFTLKYIDTWLYSLFVISLSYISFNMHDPVYNFYLLLICSIYLTIFLISLIHIQFKNIHFIDYDQYCLTIFSGASVTGVFNYVYMQNIGVNIFVGILCILWACFYMHSLNHMIDNQHYRFSFDPTQVILGTMCFYTDLFNYVCSWF